MLYHLTLLSRPTAAALALAALITTLASGTARAQTTITTIPANTFGGTQAPVFGQTFTAPTDNVLTSFAFQLDEPAEALTLSIYQYADATNTTIGNPLFTSAPTTISTVEGENGFVFDTGNLTLTTGTVYAALLTGSSSGYDGPFNISSSDAYKGGKYIFGEDTTDPFVDASLAFRIPVDTAFRATFIPANPAVAAPEPGSIALLLTAAVPVAGLVRRRAKTALLQSARKSRAKAV